MDEQSGHVSISSERIERLVSVVALASTVSVDEALALLGPQVQDRFGVVEEAMRLFLNELHEARRAATEALAEATRAKEELEEKLRTIEHQRGQIEELSAPVIDVWQGVLALPLVGRIDAERAARIAEALLERVAQVRARWVIIDLTGVAEVDEATAASLVRVAEAVELIGARCMLTGIRPVIVESLLEFGDLTRRLQPRRTLQEGLQYCLTAMRSRGGQSG